MGRKSLAKQRRAEILEAFYRCITRDGLQKASTREIAREAGVQQSALLHYFKSRDEMIEELVRNIVDSITASYIAELRRCKNPSARFNKAIDLLFGPDFSNDEHASFFYDCWSEAKRNERVRESFTNLYFHFREAVTKLFVETGKASGLSAAELKELASMIIAIQDGISIQWDMDRDNVSLKKMSLLTKRLIKLYLEDKKREGKTERKASHTRKPKKTRKNV